MMRRLQSLFRQYPFVTVTGPRQSGKTTLCKMAFPDLAYANLEAPDQRDFAESDPRGFLAQFPDGGILDEVQNVPDLLSYLQVLGDERGKNGFFILTGSQQFRLSDAISQSLAGRTALLRLLPFSLVERQRTEASLAIDDMLHSGFYPRILDQGLEPVRAHADYFETYVERHVRQLIELQNLSTFRRFVRLCAGRTGQLLNVSSLGSDTGVSHTTARAWLTVLEASYIVFLLNPFHANLKKRLIKSPKLYFYDVGLASYLLGIESASQIATHPLRGALFENLVVAEVMKHRLNRGLEPRMCFFRDSSGLECDLLYESAGGIGAIEVKSGATVSSEHFGSLNRVGELISDISVKALVYGGSARQTRQNCELVPLHELAGLLELIEADKEVSQFIAARQGSEPDGAAEKTLDAVFSSHIRPAIDGVDTACSPFAASLFLQSISTGYVRLGSTQHSSSRLLDSSQWERTKAEFILSSAYALGDASPLELQYTYLLVAYTGSNGPSPDILISMLWKLGRDGFRRTAEINGRSIPALTMSVGYSELNRRSAEVDLLRAEPSQAIIKELAEGPADD